MIPSGFHLFPLVKTSDDTIRKEKVLSLQFPTVH